MHPDIQPEAYTGKRFYVHHRDLAMLFADYDLFKEAGFEVEMRTIKDPSCPMRMSNLNGFYAQWTGASGQAEVA